MEIRWLMTEDEWKEYESDVKHIENKNIEGTEFTEYAKTYDLLTAGNLLVQIIIDYDEFAEEGIWFPAFFELGVDEAYGETDDGIPYTIIPNDMEIPENCKTFEEFKKETLKNLEKCFKKDNWRNWEQMLHDKENTWKINK